MHKVPEEWLSVLGLGTQASQEEIRDAYRDLAKVWHPDRFSHEPRLRSKAEQKLKEINVAYDNLRDYRPSREARSAPPCWRSRRNAEIWTAVDARA